MKEEELIPGSLFGGALLIAGTCIGAGMLALPIMTGLAGFFPSLLMLFIAWAFMTFTGCLLVEINGWFDRPVHLLSMAREGLGKVGYGVAWITYTLLFYSLLVAYVDGGGLIFAALFDAFFNLHLTPHEASLCFAFVSGAIIYLGTAAVDQVNRWLMAGLIAAYIGMIAVGVMKIETHNLLEAHWEKLFLSVPVLVISFGFQNLIPSLTTYMKGDLKRVRLAILIGSAIVFVIYLLWSLMVLGIVPYEKLLFYFAEGKEATEALQSVATPFLITASRFFAFFAITTSFLPVALTLAHFLGDGFRVEPSRTSMRWLVPLTIIPPLVFALYYPKFFFKALNFAGGICAMILFGIFPVLMAWEGRYMKKITSNYHVAGGKKALVLAFVFACFVLICELVRICR